MKRDLTCMAAIQEKDKKVLKNLEKNPHSSHGNLELYL